MKQGIRAVTCWGVTLTLVMIFPACSSDRADLDVLCDVASEVVKDDALPVERRKLEWVRRIRDELTTRDVTRAVVQMAALPRDEQYSHLRRFATKSGQESWDCQPLRQVLAR